MWLDFRRTDAGRCVILLAQVVTTWAMTGIIWFVQLVQYPSFAQVDAASFPAFHEHHSAAISVIVAPLIGRGLMSLNIAMLRVFLKNIARQPIYILKTKALYHL